MGSRRDMGRQVAMFAVFIILARHLGPEEFGLATLAMVAPTILATVVTRGIPDALVTARGDRALHGGFSVLAACWHRCNASALIWGSPEWSPSSSANRFSRALVRWTAIIVVVQSLAAVPTAVLKQ